VTGNQKDVAMNAENPVQSDLFGVSATRTKRHEAGRAYQAVLEQQLLGGTITGAGRTGGCWLGQP
jgi:hypothetical protein